MSVVIGCYRRALLPALAVMLLAGCAGNGSNRFAFWSRSQTQESDEQPVLSARQTADMQLALGRVAEQQQQWDKAAAAYRQVLQAQPKHPEATHRLAVLYDRRGEFELSESWFQNALKLKPGDPELFCDIGYSLSLQRRWREAEINLKQAIAIAPDHHRSHNHLGVVLAQQGNHDQALAAFRRATGSPAQAHANLALVLAMSQQPADAQRHLEQAQRLAANDAETAGRLQQLSELIAARGAPDRANATVASARAAGHSSEWGPIGGAGDSTR